MTLTMPNIQCMTDRLSGNNRDYCASEKECHDLVFFFSVAAMVFLEVVYLIGYFLGLWVSGVFFSFGAGEEAAGKVVKGFSKLKNRSSWSIRSDEQKTQRRKAKKHKDKKKKKWKGRGRGKLGAQFKR